MIRKFLLLLIILCAAAGAWHFLFSASAKYERRAQEAMYDLAKTVETQQSAKIHEALGNLIADDAHISIELHFPTPPGQPENIQPVENLSKSDFLSLVDNTLYTVKYYHFSARIQQLQMQGAQTAAFNFTGAGDAKGTSSAMMEVAIPFSIRAVCNAEAEFPPANAAPKLSGLHCAVRVEH